MGQDQKLDRRMASYVIITPACNEERFIEQTINSIIRQTVLPLKWVVVNDGSNDRTCEIVERFRTRHHLIELVNVQRLGGRDFGNKVRAFNLGLASVYHLNYEFIGNLDADISLEPDYYERILIEFGEDSKLGIAGGMVSSCIEGKFVSQDVSLDSVAGAVQLFRRRCFEETGGYLALPQGGIDAAAEILARKKGWKTRTFPEVPAFEHRRTGTATAHPLRARIKEGKRLYSLGYSFLFFFMRCVYRSMERPRIIGSGAALCGYLSAVIKRYPIVLGPDVVKYLRDEQREKILRTLKLGGYRER